MFVQTRESSSWESEERITSEHEERAANHLTSAVFLNGRLIWTLFIMLDGSKERVIYEHHFSVAVSE